MRLLLATVLLLAACGGSSAGNVATNVATGIATTVLPKPVIRTADAVPVPNWSVSDVDVTDKCASVFDYCVTVECDVTQNGDFAETGEVEMYVKQGTDPELVEIQSPSPQPHTVPLAHLKYDFNKARLFGGGGQGGCRVKSTGSKATCDVFNSGADGEIEVTAKITTEAGVSETDKRDVDIPANGSSKVDFTFKSTGVKHVECEAKPAALAK